MERDDGESVNTGTLINTFHTYSKALEENHETHTDALLTAQKSVSPTTFHAKGISEAVTSLDATNSNRTGASRRLPTPASISSSYGR